MTVLLQRIKFEDKYELIVIEKMLRYKKNYFTVMKFKLNKSSNNLIKTKKNFI